METLDLSGVIFTPKSDLVFNTYSGSDSIVAVVNQAGNTVNALAGKDQITGTAEATNGNATGIQNYGTIDAGTGKDQITGTADASGTSLAFSYGIDNDSGTIVAGADNDLITGTATKLIHI